MAITPENDPRTAMRRQDRAVEDDAWIRKFLARSPQGITATVHDGQPYLNINTFVYDESTHSIYMHTAGSGRLRTNVDADERVCFCVSAMGRLLPADTARELSVEYDSVMIFGRGTIVTDTELARAKMLMLIEKYFPHLRPGTDYRPITQQEIEEISVYRIAIESWSAKRKVAPTDFPGAFEFAAGSI